MKKNFIIFLFLLFTLLFSLPLNANETEEATNYYNQAIDLYKADRVDESIELFKKAIELNPEFYEANYNLAQILMSLNKNEEAYKALEQVVKLKPDDWESLYNIGKVQYNRGYLASSYGYLKKIDKKAPQYESAELLMDKIEKRQEELNLEAIIKEHKNETDAQGKTKGVEIEQYDAPSGIAVDSRGNIYTASYSDNAVYKISIYGQKTTFSKSVLIKGPIGIAIDRQDNVYIANYGANNIVKINSQGLSSVYADIQKPYCITYDSIHNRLYVTEQNTNKVVKFDL